MDALDLFLARAARALVSHSEPSLATKLLSCRLTANPEDGYDNGWYLSVYIKGPREMYERFWDSGGIGPAYNFLVETRVKAGASAKDIDRAELRAIAAAFRDAYGGLGDTPSLSVKFDSEYGAAGRSAEAQTELYMYVFGEDPIGQQVQVLDVGPHATPTRQLIVSPVPALPVTDLVRDEKLCFIVMPFAPQFRSVYDVAITKAVVDSGLICRRGDDISQPGAILSQIWQSMLQARLVIADLSGGNGNVLYELGLANVLGHEAILLTQNIDDVPFDLRHQRTILYSPQSEGLENLRSSLTAAIGSSLAVKH